MGRILLSQEKELKRLKEIANDKDKYNRKIKLKKLGIRIGIITDTCLPFFVAGLIITVAKPESFNDNTVKEYTNVLTIENKDGELLNRKSMDVDYDDFSDEIEFSTGWKLNDRNMYERSFIKVYYDEALKSLSKEEILKMNREDFFKKLTIKDKETIEKNKLTEEDLIYKDDGVYITNIYEDLNDYYERKKTIGEYIFEFIIAYVVAELILGFGIQYIKKVITKDVIKKKLTEKDKKLFFVDEKDLEEVKILIENREEIVNLLSDNKTLVKKVSN